VQMERMFLRFFPNEFDLAKEFSSKLPGNEISMAALQGHFLKIGMTARECVDTANSLLQTARPAKAVIKTVYEHLERVGLERYAPVFELHGYNYISDLGEVKVSDISQFNLELQYDPFSQRVMTRLLSDDATFMQEMYQLADVSTIRDSFLLQYPTKYEQTTGSYVAQTEDFEHYDDFPKITF
jgi:hypothetical protein